MSNSSPSGPPTPGPAPADGMRAIRAAGHEEVVIHHDRATGLHAIVAIHSTSLGAALGGTRFHVYDSDDAALADVLALSQAMSLKNALAGLEHGGGKAVIMADPRTDKTPELLMAYGRLIESLGGRYVTAGDVGTSVADLDVMARSSRWVTGKSPELGGGGDSGRLTAWGVFQGMRAGADSLWGTQSLAGRTVCVAGLGKVGGRLVGHLVDDGARVVAFDPDPDVVASVRSAHPRLEIVSSVDALITEPSDVFSPNALGQALTDEVASALTAALVCGAANNQLAHSAIADVLAARGILYLPDFLVNAGGVIQVADELHGYDEARASARATAIGATTSAVLAHAEELSVTPLAAAEAIAQKRIDAGPWTQELFPGLAVGGRPGH